MRNRRAHREARTDALTGIGNRRAFQEDLELVRLQTNGNAHLHLIDLDGMKRVNDSMDHSEGDRLLCTFARELKASFSEDGRVYRLGGDEFAVLTEGPGVASRRAPTERLSAFVPKLETAGFGSVGASLGSAAFQEVPEDLHEWVRLTDERLYANKRLRCGAA